MSTQDNGGPAFPVHPNVMLTEDVLWGGMTLRDYFAAKAMQGLLAAPNVKATMYEFATRSYEVADAMLKARQP